jgi:hypothetical protein
MSSEMFERSMRNRTMWVGTLWFATVAIAGAILHRSLGTAGALALASVYGFGPIGMARLTMRATPFPMWSWIATSGVMALALELSAVLSGPAQLKAWANTAWMFPGCSDGGDALIPARLVRAARSSKRLAPARAGSGVHADSSQCDVALAPSGEETQVSKRISIRRCTV